MKSVNSEKSFTSSQIVTAILVIPILYAISLPTDPLYFPVRELVIFSSLWAMLNSSLGVRLSYIQYALAPLGLAAIGAVFGGILQIGSSSILPSVVAIMATGIYWKRIEIGSKGRFVAIASIGLFITIVTNRVGYMQAAENVGSSQDTVLAIRLIWGIEHGVAIATMMSLTKIITPQPVEILQADPLQSAFPPDMSVCHVDIKSMSDTKQCPKCAETIKLAAVMCRFCRHKFEQVA